MKIILKLHLRLSLQIYFPLRFVLLSGSDVLMPWSLLFTLSEGLVIRAFWLDFNMNKEVGKVKINVFGMDHDPCRLTMGRGLSFRCFYLQERDKHVHITLWQLRFCFISVLKEGNWGLFLLMAIIAYYYQVAIKSNKPYLLRITCLNLF